MTFHCSLIAEGLPAVCIDHAKAALDTAPNKTDANDADGLALLGLGGVLPIGTKRIYARLAQNRWIFLQASSRTEVAIA